MVKKINKPIMTINGSSINHVANNKPMAEKIKIALILKK